MQHLHLYMFTCATDPEFSESGIILSVNIYWMLTVHPAGIPGGLLSGKESACNAGDVGLIYGLGRSPGGGNGNPFQYSCLGNPMNRGA